MATRLTIETRDQKMVQVDAGKARESHRYPPMVVGMTVVAAGSYDANGVLLAERVWRAKQSPAARARVRRWGLLFPKFGTHWKTNPQRVRQPP